MVNCSAKLIPKLFHLSVRPKKGNVPKQGQRKNSNQGVTRTYNLRILITLAPLTEEQSQDGSGS